MLSEFDKLSSINEPEEVSGNESFPTLLTLIINGEDAIGVNATAGCSSVILKQKDISLK